jgi:predicted aminopeptidase
MIFMAISKAGITLILSVLLGGCQSIGYYSQAVSGQVSIWMHQRDIVAVLSDTSLDTQTRVRLQTAQRARKFASRTLKLPENKSYLRYVDLERDYVLWNVVATPRYSVDAVESCFLIVGCVSYRGYYHKAAALERAQQQKNEGLDVYVGGVSAYSTLGWFDDPLLSSMLARSDAAIAGLIFHELAHQRVYIKNDTRFNESFATAVERIGLRQWGAAQGSKKSLVEHLALQQKRNDAVQLVLEQREHMRKAYLDNASAGEDKLAVVKQAQIENLKNRYAELKRSGGGTPGYDRFFASDLNNAALALFGEYHGWVDAFERLFEDSQQNWEAFYKAVDRLSKTPKVDRDQVLRSLSK